MRKFASADIPTWRLVLWGVVASLAVFGLGVYLSEPRLFIAASFAGLAIGGFGFFIRWSQQSGWASRHSRTLLVVYMILQTVLLVWRLLER